MTIARPDRVARHHAGDYLGTQRTPPPATCLRRTVASQSEDAEAGWGHAWPAVRRDRVSWCWIAGPDAHPRLVLDGRPYRHLRSAGSSCTRSWICRAPAPITELRPEPGITVTHSLRLTETPALHCPLRPPPFGARAECRQCCSSATGSPSLGLHRRNCPARMSSTTRTTGHRLWAASTRCSAARSTWPSSGAEPRATGSAG